MAASHHADQTDEALARLAGEGDRDAFAEIYRRHFEGLYDFAYRMVRGADAASDVVQHTFTRAYEQLAAGKVPDSVRAWIYIVARNAAIDEIRRSGREIAATEGADEDRPTPLATLEAGRLSDPEAQTLDGEMVSLVWDAAEGLGDEQKALLYLHVRQDLSADEMAEHLGINKGALYTRLSRLRDTFEEAVVALLLFRRGRRDCADLDALLTQMRATAPSPEVRRAVQGHVNDCETCEQSKRQLVAPSRLLAAFAFVPAPRGLRDTLWENASATLPAAASTEPPVDDRPFRMPVEDVFSIAGRGTVAAPGAKPPSRVVRKVAAAAAAVAILGGGLGAALSAAGSALDVRDPGLESPNVVGKPTTDNTIEVRLVDPDPRAGAYSYIWTTKRGQIPDTKPDPVKDSRIVSPRLSNGDWEFVIRAREKTPDGRWTSTARLGLFRIRGARPVVETRLDCDPVDVLIPAWEGPNGPLVRFDIEQLGDGRRARFEAQGAGSAGRRIWRQNLVGDGLLIVIRGEQVAVGRVTGDSFKADATLPLGEYTVLLQHIVAPVGAFTFVQRDCALTENAIPLATSPVGGAGVPDEGGFPLGLVGGIAGAVLGIIVLCWLLFFAPDDDCWCKCDAKIFPGQVGGNLREVFDGLGRTVGYSLHGVGQSATFKIEGGATCNTLAYQEGGGKLGEAKCTRCRWAVVKGADLVSTQEDGCSITVTNKMPDGGQRGWRQPGPGEKPQSCRGDVVIRGTCVVEYRCLEGSGDQYVLGEKRTLECPVDLRLSMYPCDFDREEAARQRCRDLRKQVEQAIQALEGANSSMNDPLFQLRMKLGADNARMVCNLLRLHGSLQAAMGSKDLIALGGIVKAGIRALGEGAILGLAKEIGVEVGENKLEDVVDEMWKKDALPLLDRMVTSELCAAVKEAEKKAADAQPAVNMMETVLQNALVEVKQGDFVTCCVACDLEDLRKRALKARQEFDRLTQQLKAFAARYAAACSSKNAQEFCGAMRGSR